MIAVVWLVKRPLFIESFVLGSMTYRCLQMGYFGRLNFAFRRRSLYPCPPFLKFHLINCFGSHNTLMGFFSEICYQVVNQAYQGFQPTAVNFIMFKTWVLC
jgi:hypothetical protein